MIRLRQILGVKGHGIYSFETDNSSNASPAERSFYCSGKLEIFSIWLLTIVAGLVKVGSQNIGPVMTAPAL